MENFIVSARKYRPTTFSSVIGQSSITLTLKNAIKTRHIAHSYLFCGPRGVGKTTCARILAKTINCFNITSDFEACNQCESCKSFNDNRSLNIHELDAASNNSVDDIRNLVDKVRIPPQLGKYNIYIIDEVHMLSSQAFNAFLKTLEEPPAHAIFILATTEKHKIIPTILSRCQIFDFNRIRIDDIVNHLAYVAKNEGIKAEPDALNIIAQKADGAMRDALSTFDQIVSFSGNEITYKIVIENLNILDYDYYFKLTNAFLAEDYQASLLLYDEILSNGFEGQHFLSGLSKHFRDLMVCKFPGTVKLLEVGANIGDQYLTQSSLCSADFLFSCLEISNQFELAFKNSRNQRLLVELALLKLCNVLKKKESELVNKDSDNQVVITKKAVSSVQFKSKPVVKRDEISGISVKEALLNETDQNQQKKPEYLTNSKDNQLVTANETINKLEVFNDKSDQGIKKIIENFASRYKENTRLYNLLINSSPNLSGNVIDVHFANHQQEEEFNQIKPEIEKYLDEHLNMGKIEFNLKFIETINNNHLLSSSEKLNILSEKYPDFLRLKQKFNLEL